MERRGLVDKTAVTPKMLADEVRRADDELVAGQPAAAAARLYAIVEGPRYQDFSDSDDFQDAEYRLGLALARGGGIDHGAALSWRARLQRGPKAPYYHAALRAYVDVCLDQRIAESCAAEIDKLGAEDVNEELAYLHGRALYEGNHFERAEQELARVTPKSRFYSSALYLRGVMRVKRQDLRGAEDAFCAIADVKAGDRIRFYIDGRYYALKDLARLALGRIAHEEGRDDDAFYHYFLVPSDSKKLGDALFEAGWASLGAQGLRSRRAARRGVPEALFHDAAGGRGAPADGDAASEDLPLRRRREGLRSRARRVTSRSRATSIARCRDAATRRALAERLLSADDLHPIDTHDTDGVIASMLEVDARFYRLHAIARGLAHEAADVDHVEADWQRLGERVAQTKVQAVTGGNVDVPLLLERVNELGAEVARARKDAAGSDEAEEVAGVRSSRARRRSPGSSSAWSTWSSRRVSASASGLVAMVRADRAAADRAARARGDVGVADRRAPRAS